MSNPIWITPAGNLYKTLSFSYVNIQLLANPVLPADTITYSLRSGQLPPGLTINTSGLLSGTVQYSSTSTYTFSVNATDNLGNVSYRTFNIDIITNLQQPIWNTASGNLGTYPSQILLELQLSASPVLPAISLTYEIISGSLPNGLLMNENGLIYGTPTLVSLETSNTFVVRVTDNFSYVTDRTFSIIISGNAIPQFTTPSGSILQTYDSVWVSQQITYSNPDPNNSVTIRLLEGSLPPGLEINQYGLIRGYPNKPTVQVNLPVITTAATVTQTTNEITCLTTVGFTINRPVTFSGISVFGGIVEGVTYYVKSIIDITTFTISSTPNGPTLSLTSGTGLMNVTLPSISEGQPTIVTYNFTLKLESLLGENNQSYSITVINQNTPSSQGGPGFPNNSRLPVIFNTRPPTYLITQNTEYFGYYLLPPNSQGNTYPTSSPASIGTKESDNYFAFKIIGNDFDGNTINYIFADLPTGLSGDVNTGWITGNPSIAIDGLNTYNFSVAVYKVANPALISPYINFTFNIANNISEVITWITDSDLGTLFNGVVSTKSVFAEADVNLNYRIISGSLPPNLNLLDNGEITGYTANQPTDTILTQGESTSFTFEIEAYSPLYPIIKSSKTFTMVVTQEFNQPTDVLYIKCTPSIADRVYIDTLLNDTNIIPSSYLYRPSDIYFGKATSVIYEHAYGIYSSSINEYLAAITRNHYWRNITLGDLKTAVARDENNEIVYEVVYSQVVDNLLNPEGISVPIEIVWPRNINLNLGPYYTSITDIYTSYVDVLGQEYYTSLSPGNARDLYPNSLINMRTRVGIELGQEFDSRLLPLWMTSQQENGSTLGYTQAWVIAYVKPGYGQTLVNRINALWLDPATGEVNKLNRINFKIDRFTVDKSITYNYDNSTSPPAWTGLPSATPVPDPIDSKDFYVIFPRKTILPTETQY